MLKKHYRKIGDPKFIVLPSESARFELNLCVYRLSKESAKRWISVLSETSEQQDVVTIAVLDTGNPSNIRLMFRDKKPEYMNNLPENFMSTHSVSVAISSSSCNIRFDKSGCQMLARIVENAINKAENWIELYFRQKGVTKAGRVGFIEAWTDQEIDSCKASAEDEALGITGAIIAGQILPREDFSDWPGY